MKPKTSRRYATRKTNGALGGWNGRFGVIDKYTGWFIYVFDKRSEAATRTRTMNRREIGA